MAYIGRPSIVGNFVKLDAISVVNGQAAYTMQNSSANFTDYSSVNQFMVSLNSVIQSPGSSFTVSGSTITFASNLVTNDVIDFIIVFGNSLSSGVPTDATVSTAKLADDAVTAAKINNDIISGSTELASEPADTDEFLVSDAGTLKRIDYSLIKGGGITEADMFRLTADTSNGTNADITANLERVDDATFSKIGTGMTESSGIFSFPSTGVWSVRAMITMQSHENDSQGVYIIGTDDNFSSETILSNIHVAHRATSTGAEVRNGYGEVVVDITDTSNRKIKFQVFGQNDGDDILTGSSSRMVTGFTFQRLGKT